MEGLKAFSQFLMIPSAAMLIWDLVEHWFVKNMFKVRTFKEWGNKLSPDLYAKLQKGAHVVLDHSTYEKIATTPGFLVFFAPALTLYLLYRLIFILQGGKAGGYKSRY
jgi:hypothetical protein